MDLIRRSLTFLTNPGHVGDRQTKRMSAVEWIVARLR